MGQAEEVEQGHRDAGLVGAVVEHLDPEGPEPLRRRGEHGQPQVADHPGTLDVGEDHPFAGADHPAGGALAPVGGCPAGPTGPGRVLEGDGPRLERGVDEGRVHDARHQPFPRRLSTFRVICSICGSRPANPCAQSVDPDVMTVAPALFV